MSANPPVPSVTEDYAKRVADDLSANRGEQERVRTQLARLQDELVRLEESEQILTKVQDVLGAAPKRAAKRGKSSETAAVPVARRANAKAAAGKSGAAGGRKAPKKTVSTKKPGEPTWLELTTDCLGGQSEPRSAAEVSASLTDAYPERAVQVTVVRNTLEQGVAKGLVERSRQGRSVFYSQVAAAPAPTDS